MNGFILLLSILYLVAGGAYFYVTVRSVIHRNQMVLFDYMKLMYSFAFGFLPALIYGIEAFGTRNLYYYDYSAEGIGQMFLFMAFSVLVFFVLSFGYSSVLNNKVQKWYQKALSFLEKKSKTAASLINKIPKNKKKEMLSCESGEVQEKSIGIHLLICGIVCLLIGFISLLLWTHAYGSIANFIKNAARIRSGNGKISNPLAFMKQFVKVMPITTYSFIASWFYLKPKGKWLIGLISLIGISLFGNYLYLMTSDSRSSVMLMGIGVVAILIRHSKEQKIVKTLIRSAIVVVILLGITMGLDVITTLVRSGKFKISGLDFANKLITEFQFIYASATKCMKALFSGSIELQIGNDLLNSLTRWIPERFVPFSIPGSLWNYNSNLIERLRTGTLPSGIVTSAIYEFGIPGLFTHPFIFGGMAALFEKFIDKKSSAKVADVFLGLLTGLFVLMVPYNEFSYFVEFLFPLFLFYLVSLFIRKVVEPRMVGKIKGIH